VPTEAEVVTRITDAEAWFKKAHDILKALPKGAHARSTEASAHGARAIV